MLESGNLKIILMFYQMVGDRNPTVKFQIPEKAFLKSEFRTSVTFKIFSHFFHGSVLAEVPTATTGR